MTKPEPQIVVSYPYVNEDGALLYEVCRLEPKSFRQRRPVGDSWSWNLGDTRRVIYRLPEVLAHIGTNTREPIYVCEGEKDVEAFEAIREVATCNPMGSGKWRDEYAESLQGARRVIVVADRDEQGRRHAEQVVKSLAGVGLAAEVVEAAEGKDASDHFAAGYGVEDFRPVMLGDPARVRTYDELMDEFVRERGQEDYEPVRLGFGSIDSDIRGVSTGQVCGIAARTAVGKTWALAAVEHTFAARGDLGSLVVSLEMPGPEWAERALAIDADVAPETVEAWAKAGELGTHAAAFLERMQNALVVDEPVSMDELPAVFAEARDRLRVPLRLVLIDYLGLLEVPGRDAYERASAIGKGLKRIAKLERVAIVVAMQVSRAGGDGSEPVTKQMLRDSGVLEESVDFLLGAWRPGKAQNLAPPDAIDLKNVMRVQLLKNRKGEDGRVVDLRFRDESRQLYEPSEVF